MYQLTKRERHWQQADRALEQASPTIGDRDLAVLIADYIMAWPGRTYRVIHEMRPSMIKRDAQLKERMRKREDGWIHNPIGSFPLPYHTASKTVAVRYSSASSIQSPEENNILRDQNRLGRC